ncbi:MAG: chemotaxis protein CheC [Myxococcota bacterium]|jgi:chemotaxis protein CheC|nr:chemotaxis protein CheC [Myxococcota bacterium]
MDPAAAATLHDVGDELDRLCELANVGAGHAATALARLVKRPIRMSVPRLRMGAAAPAIDGPDGGDAWIFFEVQGALGGALVLRLPGAARAALVAELVGDDETGAHAESALREVGNILASHALSAVADLVGSRVLPSLPSLVFEATGPALAAWRARATGRVCIETHLVDDAGRATVELVWIPNEVPGGAARAPF